MDTEPQEAQEEPTFLQIPVVPLRGGAVFPGITTTIAIGRHASLTAVQTAVAQGGSLLILVQYNPELENPTNKDIAPIGILATVRDILRAPHIGVQMLVELHRRVQFHALVSTESHLEGRYSELPPTVDCTEAHLKHKAIAYLEQYADTLGEANPQLTDATRHQQSAGELADYIAGLLNLPFTTELALLQTLNGGERLVIVTQYLEQELHITALRQKIRQEARANTDKAQREYMLREQMRVIRRELGEEGDDPATQLRHKIAASGMPAEVAERATKEAQRLAYQGPQSPEAGVIRTYLEWLTELPWAKASEDNLDIHHARAVLDADHFGLDEVKERIVEYIAVRKMAGARMRGAIINLNGPPGVGKTSIATSVARAMGRQMVRISLGGVRDEAEIRGHRRTYIGAMPGRVIRALRDAGVRNPVIILDEIDKVGADWRGDPAAALLEALDPEQNHNFTDHYLEAPFDLSQVIFITTSNELGGIPPALLDRLETIQMSGYIEEEKMAIAHEYLLPKQLAGHGLEEASVCFMEGAWQRLIRYHTREAGVRQLERNIGAIVRKLAVKIAGGEMGPFSITAVDITYFLGPDKFHYGAVEERDEIGVATGLAVNAFGGDTLSIEVSLSEGNGRVTLTGSMGEVMQESAQAALTYARANARRLGLDPALFDQVNVHIHVPEGAVPKDGPSAGIGMATAVISAFTQRPVRCDVALTGEVTLRGKVLAVGSLKEKAIAAHRAGIRTMLLPADNARDIPGLPERVRQDLTLIPVKHLEQVLALALLPGDDGAISLSRGESQMELPALLMTGNCPEHGVRPVYQ